MSSFEIFQILSKFTEQDFSNLCILLKGSGIVGEVRDVCYVISRRSNTEIYSIEFIYKSKFTDHSHKFLQFVDDPNYDTISGKPTGYLERFSNILKPFIRDSKLNNLLENN